MRLPIFAALLLCILAVTSRGHGAATPVITTTLENVFQLDDTMYSGSSPDSEEAFRELAKLGVKTIISVDGSKPNVALAHRFGMRYVHLPFGYDGIPATRAAELVKAAQGANGPLYVHCHHGKHRGPAAAATICRARDDWSAERADEFLKQAGTAADYLGLFRDVRAFHPPTSKELARLSAKFPEVAETPELVDAMVTIDEQFDALKAARKSGWHNVPGNPTPAPPQPSVLLWEQLCEIARTPDSAQRNDDYRAKLADAEHAADALRQLLRDPAGDTTRRNAAMDQLANSCAACHKAHRN